VRTDFNTLAKTRSFVPKLGKGDTSSDFFKVRIDIVTIERNFNEMFEGEH